MANKFALILFFLSITSPALSRELPRVPLLKADCTRCHKILKKEPASTPMKTPHHNLTFKHMKEVTQCILCHSEKKPDQLQLLDATPLSYENSSTQCGQCHGRQFREWKSSIHGKEFRNPKQNKTQKLSCVECHEAHNPKFPSMKAVRPPQKPKFVILKEHDRAKQGHSEH